MLPLSVVVVDDNKGYSHFVCRVLGDHYADLLELRAACPPCEALQRCVTIQPEVILLDLGLPGLANLSLIGPLRQSVPGVVVIVLSREDQAPYVAAAQRAGAVALLGKGTLNTTLRATIASSLLQRGS